jgi:hypothetical protein
MPQHVREGGGGGCHPAVPVEAGLFWNLGAGGGGEVVSGEMEDAKPWNGTCLLLLGHTTPHEPRVVMWRQLTRHFKQRAFENAFHLSGCSSMSGRYSRWKLLASSDDMTEGHTAWKRRMSIAHDFECH